MQCQTGIQSRFQNNTLACCTEDSLSVNVCFCLFVCFCFWRKNMSEVYILIPRHTSKISRLNCEDCNHQRVRRNEQKQKQQKNWPPFSLKILFWYSHSWLSFSPPALTESCDAWLTNKTHKIDNMLLLRLQKCCDPLSPPHTCLWKKPDAVWSPLERPIWQGDDVFSRQWAWTSDQPTASWETPEAHPPFLPEPGDGYIHFPVVLSLPSETS